MFAKKLLLFTLLTFAATSQVFAMNKAELIDAIAKDSGLSKADAKRALETFTNETAKALKKGYTVSLVGFGSFSVSSRIVNFDEDLPLVKATYGRFVQDFWNDVNTYNSQNMRALAGTPDSFFDIIYFGARGFDDMIKSEDPLLMLDEKSRRAYSEYLGKSLSEVGRTLVSAQAIAREEDRSSATKSGETAAHEAAHVIQQRVGQNLKSALIALMEQAESMEKSYIYTDTPGDNKILINGKANKKLDVTDDKGRAFYKSFVNVMTAALKKGDRVSLVGFGSFSISKRAARTGRNPQTGKEIKIAAKNVVKFKAGADLSKKVN